MIDEIRMYLAEILLRWAVSLVPDSHEGALLVKMVRRYYEELDM